MFAHLWPFDSGCLQLHLTRGLCAATFTCEDHLSGNEDEQDNSRFNHSVDETREKLGFITRAEEEEEGDVRVTKALRAITKTSSH